MTADQDQSSAQSEEETWQPEQPSHGETQKESQSSTFQAGSGKPAALSLSEEEFSFFENLKDWKWRIKNLYYIKDKWGRKVKFTPNWAQLMVIEMVWFFSIILKARQLGITTFFCILYLDQILFNSNKTAAIIAHTDADSKKIFNKVKFAWEHLPATLKENIGEPNTDSAGEMSFPNGSNIYVARSTRGGTLQFLHISEFAKICAKYPEKAREIVTGAINSVEKGNFVTIESTAEGKQGYFFKYWKEAINGELAKKELTELDFKPFFFPWWKEPTYRLKGSFSISAEHQAYFAQLEAVHKIYLDDEQKRWYIAKKNKNDEDMFREYPSIEEEAFQAAVEGAYYSRQMKLMYEQQRIRNIPWDARFPVDTWWDLGVNDLNVILFTQSVGNEVRFIDMYFNNGEGLGHYVNELKKKPYTYGQHTFPHDVEVQNLDGEGKTRRETLNDLGMRNIRTIERTKDINDDIEGVRKLFSRFYFNESTMSSNDEKKPGLVEACNSYAKEWDDKLGQFRNNPKHDVNSHIVDPLRLIARGWKMIDNMTQGGEAKITNFF